ncbi:MAG: T9SS type A sorting domain-containing protein, partial [Bacteroidetes bacterium]|nr:T9SS type A sorting domain-containing protein [Bacteroidota bacterium]MBU1579908.1 T9SS type A sorting domain-containing protein [Bacteroidota bacterium]
ISSARIYPNPATDFVYISAEENIREISIINQQGQLVQKEGNKLQQDRIDLSNLPAGIYTLMLETENGLITRKQIKY